MKVYLYNPTENNKYENSVECQINPKWKEGDDERFKYLIPSNSTTIEPLQEKEHYDICFNIKMNKWEYKREYSYNVEIESKDKQKKEEKEYYNNLSINTIKKNKLEELKEFTYNYISETYPIYKQIDILLEIYNTSNSNGETEKEIMKNFINKKIEVNKIIKQNLIDNNNKDSLYNYNIKNKFLEVEKERENITIKKVVKRKKKQ